MPAETPTKPTAALADKPAEKPSSENPFDRFHPEMPKIPGVAGARMPSPAKPAAEYSQKFLQILGIAAVAVVAIIGIVWWMKSASRKAADVPATEPAASDAPVPQLPSFAVPAANAGPSIAGTSEELGKPWSAKKFTFVKPVTGESVPAMVIRLPGGALWAFALQEPYGRCQLEYIPDPAQLSAKYGYQASHPMVVNPCNSTVYDPLKVGPLGDNTWARGDVVQGSGLRPPLSIDVVVHGRSIVADRME